MLNVELANETVGGSAPPPWPATVTVTDQVKSVSAANGGPPYLTFCDFDDKTSPESHKSRLGVVAVAAVITLRRYDTCLCPLHWSVDVVVLVVLVALVALDDACTNVHGATHEKRGAATSTPRGASMYSTRSRYGADGCWAWIGNDSREASAVKARGRAVFNIIVEICPLYM